MHRPDLTAERFIPNPYSDVAGALMYRTGDLSRWRSNGDLECLGRNDSQVKVRGYRIELGDIEAALAEHPQVKQVVVKVHEASSGDKRLVGYVVSEAGKPPQAEQLRSYLLDRLPDYMVPAQYVHLEKFALTPNGKIDRKALSPADETSTVGDNAWCPPENEAEQKVAGIWKALLDTHNSLQIGRDSNFFDLGGHSLLLIRMRNRLEEAFGMEIAMVDLFRNPTVRTLAKHLSSPQQTPVIVLTRSLEKIQAQKEAAQQRLQRRQSGRL
jgi:acyl carrier protein